MKMVGVVTIGISLFLTPAISHSKDLKSETLQSIQSLSLPIARIHPAQIEAAVGILAVGHGDAVMSCAMLLTSNQAGLTLYRMVEALNERTRQYVKAALVGMMLYSSIQGGDLIAEDLHNEKVAAERVQNPALDRTLKKVESNEIKKEQMGSEYMHQVLEQTVSGIDDANKAILSQLDAREQELKKRLSQAKTEAERAEYRIKLDKISIARNRINESF